MSKIQIYLLEDHPSSLNLDFKYLNKIEMIEGDTFTNILQMPLFLILNQSNN